MSTPRFLLLSVAFLLGNYASTWLGILPDWDAAHERTYVQLIALLFAFACLRRRVSTKEEG